MSNNPFDDDDDGINESNLVPPPTGRNPFDDGDDNKDGPVAAAPNISLEDTPTFHDAQSTHKRAADLPFTAATFVRSGENVNPALNFSDIDVGVGDNDLLEKGGLDFQTSGNSSTDVPIGLQKSPLESALLLESSTHSDKKKSSNPFDDDDDDDDDVDNDKDKNDESNLVRHETPFYGSTSRYKNIPKQEETGLATTAAAALSVSTQDTSHRYIKESPLAMVHVKNHKRPVLHKIQVNNSDEDPNPQHHSLHTPWHKIIKLEELGTASSWLLLLLPYIAVVVAFGVDYMVQYNPTFTRSVSWLANETCSSLKYVNTNHRYFDVPLVPVPKEPCLYPATDIITSSDDNNGGSGGDGDDFSSLHILLPLAASSHAFGYAFTSAALSDVHPLATYITGDAVFQSITTAALDLVASGDVLVSTQLYQAQDNDDEWVPLYHYTASDDTYQNLPLVCALHNQHLRNSTTDMDDDDHNNDDFVSADRWSCSSPGLVDILFALPGTDVYTGKKLRLEVVLLYNHTSTGDVANGKDVAAATNKTTTTQVELSEAEAILQQTHAQIDAASRSENLVLLHQLARAMELTVQYPRTGYTHLAIGVRYAMLICTLIFFVYWNWSMGTLGLCWGCCGFMGGRRVSGYSRIISKVSMWWESPWILLPERRYLACMMISLILLQNPILALFYFDPTLYSSPMARAIADTCAGIGIQGVLFCWLCLIHSLRYHTATIARKRAEQQRQILLLQKVAEMRAASYDAKLHPEQHEYAVASYYDQYGDVDGMASIAASYLRLKSDPCGSDWADFLLMRLLLLLLGISTVVLTAFTRFPESIGWTDENSLEECNKIYVISSLVQLVIMTVWVLLIWWNTIVTGDRLKKQPFLSTRPAQLAFRVLFSIQLLGLIAVAFPYVVNMNGLIHKWFLDTGLYYNHDSNTTSATTTDDEMDDAVIADDDIKYTTGVGDDTWSFIDTNSAFGKLFAIMLHATKRMPFADTAAAIGPGTLIYITISCLSAAFVFLPPAYFYEEGNSSGGLVASPSDRSFSQDKRRIVTLARKTHTWRVFPLPIERLAKVARVKPLSQEELFERMTRANFAYGYDNSMYTSVRSIEQGPIHQDDLKYGDYAKLSKRDKEMGLYTPVFCLELACFLLECSWQSYYSHDEFRTDDFAPGKLSLEKIGLRLESAFSDDATDTCAYVCTNMQDQVDGEEDSIIVVTFRGTTSATTMKNNLKSRQVPLPEAMSASGGTKSPKIIVRESCAEIEDGALRAHLLDLSNIAKKVLKCTPGARHSFPRIHQGFLDAYSAIREDVLKTIVEVYQRQFDKSMERWRGSDCKYFSMPKIYICGHSLGGSLGQLLALDLASNIGVFVERAAVDRDPRAASIFDHSVETEFIENVFSPSHNEEDHFFPAEEDLNDMPVCFQPPIAVYTFGQTRVGNRAFAKLYKSRVPHTFRVCAEGDALTAMPMQSGWCLGGALYKHAGLEVALDEGRTGNLCVGPTIVETLFRFSKVRTNLSAHSMECYRDCLESGFAEDELEEYYQGHAQLDSRTTNVGTAPSTVPSWVMKIKR